MRRVNSNRRVSRCLRSALELGHNYIGTEHLLLGLLKERESSSESIVALMGVRTEEVRDCLSDLLSGATAAGAPGTPQSPAPRSALPVARHGAGVDPMTTGHVLSAEAADTDSQAAKALMPSKKKLRRFPIEPRSFLMLYPAGLRGASSVCGMPLYKTGHIGHLQNSDS
jgi:ATP-dependent Clp protease ATP-binding subunit ClpA